MRAHRKRHAAIQSLANHEAVVAHNGRRNSSDALRCDFRRGFGPLDAARSAESDCGVITSTIASLDIGPTIGSAASPADGFHLAAPRSLSGWVVRLRNEIQRAQGGL